MQDWSGGKIDKVATFASTSLPQSLPSLHSGFHSSHRPVRLELSSNVILRPNLSLKTKMLLKFSKLFMGIENIFTSNSPNSAQLARFHDQLVDFHVHAKLGFTLRALSSRTSRVFLAKFTF
jgi:hypothetical protein